MVERPDIDELRKSIKLIEEGGSPKPPSISKGDVRGCAVESGKREAREQLAQADKSCGSAFSKAVRLLNASDKSAKKLKQRLVLDGFDADIAEQAVDKAVGYGLCDDMRFARVLVRSRLAQGRGLSGIERELRENGIEASMLEGWPDDFIEGEPDELDRAMRFLEHHPPRSKNQREGAYRKLVSKGFSSSIASSAARAWSESR